MQMAARSHVFPSARMYSEQDPEARTGLQPEPRQPFDEMRQTRPQQPLRLSEFRPTALSRCRHKRAFATSALGTTHGKRGPMPYLRTETVSRFLVTCVSTDYARSRINPQESEVANRTSPPYNGGLAAYRMALARPRAFCRCRSGGPGVGPNRLGCTGRCGLCLAARRASLLDRLLCRRGPLDLGRQSAPTPNEILEGLGGVLALGQTPRLLDGEVAGAHYRVQKFLCLCHLLVTSSTSAASRSSLRPRGHLWSRTALRSNCFEKATGSGARRVPSTRRSPKPNAGGG